MKLARTFAIIAALALSIASAHADPRDDFRPSGKTFIVDPTDPKAFHKIQNAVYFASPGDSVQVYPGVYHESLLIDKEIYIEGVGGDKSEIILQTTEDHACAVFIAERGAIRSMTLSNFETRGFVDPSPSCVFIASGNLLLADNDIRSGGRAAVEAKGDKTNPVVIGNRIHGSESSGILVDGRAEGLFEDNDIVDHFLASVTVRGNANPVFIRNRINSNKSFGIYVKENGQGRFEKNSITGNLLAGIFVTGNGNPVFIDNRIYNINSTGIKVTEGAKGRFERNDVERNEINIEVSDNANPIFIGNRIGGGKNIGVFVRNKSKGHFENNDIFDNAEANVAIVREANPTFVKNKIRNGGKYGIAVSKDGKGQFQDNDITSNADAGVLIIHRGEPVFQHNRITGNAGAAIEISFEGHGTIVSNDLTGNEGGAWNIKDSAGKISQNGNKE